MMNAKRPKRCHDAQKTSYQDKLFLRRLAIELNNVGAELQEVGVDDAFAIALHREAALSDSEALQAKGSDVERCSITDRLEKLMKGKEKICSALHIIDDEQDANCDHIDISKTLLFTQPLKISAKSSQQRLHDTGVSHLYESGTASAVILYNTGLILYKRGQLKEAAHFFEKALEMVDDNPLGSIVFPVLHNNLGHIYYSLGRCHEGSVAFLESWRLGQEGIANLDDDCGKFSNDKECSRSSSAVRLMQHYRAVVLHNNGLVYYLEGDYGEAMDCFCEAWNYADKPSIALKIVAYMNCIGQDYHRKGMLKQAIRAYKRAMDTRNKMETLCTTFPSKLYSTILHDMGIVSYKMGKYRTAMHALTLSLRFLRLSIGKDDPRLVLIKNQIDTVAKLIETARAAAAA